MIKAPCHHKSCYFFLPSLLRICLFLGRVRVKSVCIFLVKYISSFDFFSPLSVSEKPTFGIIALRSTVTSGDVTEDRRGELIINTRSAEIRKSSDEF